MAFSAFLKNKWKTYKLSRHLVREFKEGFTLIITLGVLSPWRQSFTHRYLMDTQYVLSMCECTFLALLICVLQGHIILQKLCIRPVVPVMCLGFLSFESRAIGARYLWTNCALQYGTICAREFLYLRVWEHLCSRVFVLEQKVKAIRHLSQVLAKSLSVLFYLRKHR